MSWGAVPMVLSSVTVDGLIELFDYTWMPEPQDFRYTVETIERAPGAASLASHASLGVVISQACGLEFLAAHCPFPLVVSENPSRSDSWAFEGYNGRIVRLRDVRSALGGANTVYVFSRYLCTPLAQLGIDAERYPRVEWDDGELIGPVPVRAFGTRQRNSTR